MSTTTQYTDEKYVPRVADPVEWDANREYEHLTIVMHDGDSYISKQEVPRGAQITNTRYWLKTNNFSAQLNQTIKKANSGIEKADEALAKFPVSIPNGGTGATTAANARSNLGLGNVENKSSATIRNELTKANVTSALGYTPSASNTDTTYSFSQDSNDGHKLTLTSSDGTSKTVTIPDNDTKALESMTGTLSISHGGTGKTTAAEAWTALGGGSVGKKNSLAASDIPSLDASKIGSGTLGIARGGTGATSAAAARTNLGVTAANIVDNNAIKPSSVAATGAISSNTDIIIGGALKSSSKIRSTSYVSGGKGSNALVYAEKEAGKGYWYPTITIQTNGGGSWQIGNYNNENLQFVYFDKSHLDANDNSGQLYLNITPSGIDPTYLSGTVPINKGGTGKTTATDAWAALGGGSIGKKNSLAASDIPSIDASKIGSGTLPISHGGTGATNAANAFKNLSGYALDIGTNNTTDTWVPVFRDGKIQHREIPANVQDGTLYHWSGGTSSNSLHAYKRSGMVTIYYASSSAVTYNNTVIQTVPAGYRPPIEMLGAAYADGGANVAVETDGRVIGYGPNYAAYWRFVITFPAA